MNDLSADIGYKSINHAREQLCGDHVDIVEQDEDSMVIVLADGMGSGVKASILSTLTAKIISTMVAAGMPLKECVETIAKTLPIDQSHGVAYATFTVMRIDNNETMKLIQYDNPDVIFLRDGQRTEYDKTKIVVEDKTIYYSEIKLQEGDLFLAMSDGCPYANKEEAYNMNWGPDDIAEFMEIMSVAGYTAKGLASLLVDECDKLYGGEPRDDVTACVIQMRKREPLNILFGPPANRNDSERMMRLFFSKEGRRIICGGTTSSIAARWLDKPIRTDIVMNDDIGDLPPIASLEGVDLVTEGVITMSKVASYIEDYVQENLLYDEWSRKKDGASRITRMILEEATDIHFFVGRAKNPMHQNPDLPINFNVKMNIVKEIVENLKQIGKKVTVIYF